MELSDLQRTWNDLGQQDPLWAILSEADKIDNRWDPVEFFQTGIAEVDAMMRYVDSLKAGLSKKRALDFGCGVGRLTQALCRHFAECGGVDIAPSMINLARKYNRYGDRCAYYLNESDRFSAFENDSWDFICSMLVLQHMRPEYSKRYIQDFLRILRPGGIALFQLTAEFVVAASSPMAGIRLPESAFKASITPRVTSVVAMPSSRIHISAVVKNLSSAVWPSVDKTPGLPISLGNHWFNDHGELIALDDARAALERDLGPNEEMELTLVATAPAIPGNYVIELDLVQNLVAWFADRGSAVARVRAQITGDLASASSDPSGLSTPRIEMYGVSKEEVIEIVTGAGGAIIDVREDLMVGLKNFTYCVTKP